MYGEVGVENIVGGDEFVGVIVCDVEVLWFFFVEYV